MEPQESENLIYRFRVLKAYIFTHSMASSLTAMILARTILPQIWS